jgi:phospholipase C
VETAASYAALRHPAERCEVGEATLSRRRFLAGIGGLATAVALGDCSSSAKKVIRRATAACPPGRSLEAIEHVVFVMQENRSFDHYFGSYRGVRGFDDHVGNKLGAFTQPWPGGSEPQLLPYRLDAATRAAQCAGNADIPIHDWGPQHDSWAQGKMDGFVATHSRTDGAAQGPLVMGYFTRADLGFYYALADAFTICDAYHCSVIGPTMPNRLYALSATIDPSGAKGGPVVSTPGFADAPAAVGSARWTTMPEQLSAHNVSWKVYQPPSTAIGPDERENLAVGFNALLYFQQFLDPRSELYARAFLPLWPTDFVSDIKNGTLPQVSWMIPPLVDSEHPSAAPDNGEWFVSQVLSALTANPAVWSKTVMILTYDENGGFFDHVAPPTAPPGTPGEELTVSPLPSNAGGQAGPIGLGFRVPAIIVSPFSRGGWVNSDLFDHTSLLRFLETRFGVPVPNLTAWRRSTVGDLTSTLDIAQPDMSVPSLPAAPLDPPAVAAACPVPQNAGSLLVAPPALAVPARQAMPTQEQGAPRRRRCAPAKR